MTVKPAREGELVRDPHTKRALPAAGGTVPDTSFWRRRLAAGDVVLVNAAPAPTGLEPPTPITTRSKE